MPANNHAVTPTAEQIAELGSYIANVQREYLDFVPTMPEWYEPIAAAMQANACLGEEYKIAPWDVPAEWVKCLAGVWQATTIARVNRNVKRLNSIPRLPYTYIGE
jgi:hypothetical protein